ncbi:MAG TPA: hypothetical protein VF286_07160 [Acidiphilium sp.]
MSFARNLPLVNLAVLLGLLGLAGCGFHPLYGSVAGQPPDVTTRMDQIDIGHLSNRDGQLMRQALESSLQRAGAPTFYRYHLAVSYGISVQGIGLQPDSSSTRNRYMADARWTLTPEGNRGVTLASGNAHAADAENVIDNQNFMGTLDNGIMRHRLAKAIADQIATQIAIYFHNHPDRG